MYIGTLPRSQTWLYLEYRQAEQFLNVDLCPRCNHYRIDIRTQLNLWPLAEPTAMFSADIMIRSSTNCKIILTACVLASCSCSYPCPCSCALTFEQTCHLLVHLARDLPVGSLGTGQDRKTRSGKSFGVPSSIQK